MSNSQSPPFRQNPLASLDRRLFPLSSPPNLELSHGRVVVNHETAGAFPTKLCRTYRPTHFHRETRRNHYKPERVARPTRTGTTPSKPLTADPLLRPRGERRLRGRGPRSRRWTTGSTAPTRRRGTRDEGLPEDTATTRSTIAKTMITMLNTEGGICGPDSVWRPAFAPGQWRARVKLRLDELPREGQIFFLRTRCCRSIAGSTRTASTAGTEEC